MSVQTDDDLWAWARTEPQPEVLPPGADRVVAVLVAHNGEQWLEQALKGLAQLEQRPGRIIGVDAGSFDATASLLYNAKNEKIIDAVVHSPAEEGFGVAVQLALATEDVPENGWLWLLHDDLEPRKDSLVELLRAANEPPVGQLKADLLVPKLLHPRMRNRPDQMGAIGESISITGERVVSAERGDIDQRQDEAILVLGGSTAGLFISVDAWHRLGGLNPAIPLFRDGVDLGWRANEAGLVVRTAPEAGLYHHRAGLLGARDSVIATNPDLEDRLIGMRVVAAHSPHFRRTKVFLALACIGKSFAMLLGKSPAGARNQLVALRRFLRENKALADIRDEVEEENNHLGTDLSGSEVSSGSGVQTEVSNKVKAASDRVSSELLPGAIWSVRRTADQIAGAITERYRDFVSEDSTASLDELTSDNYVAHSFHSRLASPAGLGVLLALIGTLIASLNLLGFGSLSSLNLLPAPNSLSEAWSLWAKTTPEAVGSNAPWLGVMALISTVAFAQPSFAISGLILGGPALAAWSAHGYFRRRLGREASWQAVGLAGLWGLLLPVFSLTSHGALDATIAAIILPRLASRLHLWRTASTTGAEGLRIPGAIALWITLLSALYPLAWGFAAVLVIAVGLARRDYRGLLIAVLAPLVALASWVPQLVSNPGRLLTGIDPTTSSAGAPVNAFLVLLGRNAESATPLIISILVVVGIAVLGLCSLAILPNESDPNFRRTLAGIAVVAPTIGVLISRFVVKIDNIPVRPDGRFWMLIGSWALLSLGGLLAKMTAKRTIIDETEPAELPHAASIRRVLATVICATIVVSVGWWLVGGAGAPLHKTINVWPSYVSNLQNSPRQTRTLMVDLVDGRGDYTLVSAASPRWGSGEKNSLNLGKSGNKLVAEVVQQFSEGQPSDDLAERLGSLGIAHVWLRGAKAEAISTLRNASGLSGATAAEDTTIWTVAGLPSRASIRVAEVETSLPEPQISAGEGERFLILAEPADRRWVVKLDGITLQQVDSEDWRAKFVLPNAAGTLTWTMRKDWVGIIGQTLSLLVILVLAAPSTQAVQQVPRRALRSQAKRGAK